MAVTSLDIFECADKLSDIKGNEAYIRSCVSRLYYSAYHASNEFHQTLKSPGQQLADVGVHENLVHQLNHPNIPESDVNHEVSVEISQYLKKCLFNRRVADYKLKDSMNDRNLNIVKSETNLIFDSVKI